MARSGSSMKTPRSTKVVVDARACCSYKPGHDTHWIAALRVYAHEPRDPITVVSADAEGWITFRDQESKEHRWWHHDAARVIALVRDKARFWEVRGSYFLVAQRYPENAFPWLYCDAAPSSCVLSPSDDPIDAIMNEGGFSMSGPKLVAKLAAANAAKKRKK
jgi:hypothetical protein